MKEAHGKLWDSVNESKKQVKLNGLLLKSVYKCGKKKKKRKKNKDVINKKSGWIFILL